MALIQPYTTAARTGFTKGAAEGWKAETHSLSLSLFLPLLMHLLTKVHSVIRLSACMLARRVLEANFASSVICVLATTDTQRLTSAPCSSLLASHLSPFGLLKTPPLLLTG